MVLTGNWPARHDLSCWLGRKTSHKQTNIVTKPTNWHVCPAKTRISLGFCPIWSESSLCTWRKLGSLATHWAHSLSFLQADSEDSDQTGRMPRLIWVFAGRTCHFVGFVTMWLKSWLVIQVHLYYGDILYDLYDLVIFITVSLFKDVY